jgi:hypothetical protein
MAARSSKGALTIKTELPIYRAGIVSKCASIAAASSWYE